MVDPGVVLHGLWTHRCSLHLWVELPGRPTVGAVELAGPALGAGAAPPLHPRVGAAPAPVLGALQPLAPALAEALGHRSRATVDLLLPTGDDGLPSPSDDDLPAGDGGAGAEPAPWRVPGSTLAPDRAAAVLAEVAALERAPHGELDAAGLAVADDLRFLADLADAATRRVRAGAVVPDLVEVDGSWWGRWVQLPDTAWQHWCRTAAAAAPRVLAAEVGAPPLLAVVEQLTGELTDHLVGRAAAALAGEELGREGVRASWTTSGTAARAAGAWASALVAGAPVAGLRSDLTALAARAAAWRTSRQTSPVELVLRVDEPRAGLEALDDDLSESEGPTGGVGPGAPWRLHVRLRLADDPSVVMTPDEAGAAVEAGTWPVAADPWTFTLTELARAGAVHPPLLSLLQAATGGGPAAGQAAGRAGADGDGDRLSVDLDAGQLVELVATGAPALLEAGVAVLLPGRWLRPEVSMKLLATAHDEDPGTAAVARGPDDPGRLALGDLVDYSWQVALGDMTLTEAELSALVDGRSPLVRLRGQWVQVDADRLERSLRFLRRGGSGTTTLGGVLAQAAGVGAPEPVAEVRATGWVGDLLSGGLARAPAPLPAPRGLAAQLRPYQQRGLEWLAAMSSLGLGVVLADDMGLGKTVQLLALLVHEREAARRPLAPTLLVCPMSVVGNWQREAARFAPDLRVHVHHGPARLAGEALAAAVAGADLVVTTYAVVTRDAADLAATAWGRVAVDEAQHVKNPGTKAARAVRAVAGPPTPPGGTHRVALTGTPVENRLAELHAILDLANPGVLGSAATFRERFAVPVERDRDAGATALLATLTRPFVLRRVKTDASVIADLPEKIEMVVRANLTAEQAALYQAVLDDVMKRIEASRGMERRGLVLSALTRLKQVCNHPAHALGDGSPLLRRGAHRSGKLALLDDVLEAVLADGERALLFTQYREFGSMLVAHLSQRCGASVPFLHGGVPAGARDEMVARFSGPDGPPAMLLSLRAGGTGLNLTAANHVVHLDRWWNPAVEDQATDRAHRIGQTRGVQVRKMVCVGTLEERIDALMASKRELADAVVGAGEGWLTELATDDLRELLSLGDEAVGD